MSNMYLHLDLHPRIFHQAAMSFHQNLHDNGQFIHNVFPPANLHNVFPPANLHTVFPPATFTMVENTQRLQHCQAT